MEKSCKEGHPFPVESTFACLATPLPETRADNSALACYDCLALIEVTQLSEPNCLDGEKLARLGG